MSDQLTTRPTQPGDAPGALRVLALVAVCAGVAALAAAAFVLSYPGVHAFALQAGISARLARGYPLIFDVLLVIILAAVLSLRGAGLPSKVLAWTCLLALLAAAAGADALHAAGSKLPARTAAVTAAVVPWVLVLIAFALLLAMLRQARLRRLFGATVSSQTQHGQGRTQWQPQVPPPLPLAPLVPGLAGPALADADPPDVELADVELAEVELAELTSAGPPDSELAIDADLVRDDPSADGTPPGISDVMVAAKNGRNGAEKYADSDAPSASADTMNPAPTADEIDGDADPEMPVFHRMWSTPVPPAAEDE